MSDRYSAAEQYYQGLLTGQAGLQEVIPCSISGVNKVNKVPAFSFFLDKVTYGRMLVESGGNIVMLKTLSFNGILFVGSGGLGLDDARLVAYPIIGQVRALLDGSIFTYPPEYVGPGHTTDEGPIQITPGKYAWLISWEFEMQYTKGVA